MNDIVITAHEAIALYELLLSAIIIALAVTVVDILIEGAR